MKRKLNIDPKEAAIRKRNISEYNDNLRIILKEGGNYHCDNGKFLSSMFSMPRRLSKTSHS